LFIYSGLQCGSASSTLDWTAFQLHLLWIIYSGFWPSAGLAKGQCLSV